MPHITKRTLGPLLVAGILICFGYVAAQQSPSQQSGRTQTDKPLATQNDQLAQLQMQVKDLQAAIDDLKSEQQVIAASTKEPTNSCWIAE
jgi:cell division protein FtsB